MKKYYKLLWSQKVPQPKKNLLRLKDERLTGLFSSLNNTKFAFDFEASGLDVHGPVFWVRTVSFHNDEHSFSVEIREPDGGVIDLEAEKSLFGWLSTQNGLIAHNYFYEGSILYRATKELIWAFCDTRKLFMDLANEGYEGQSWSLDEAMRRILEWEPNDTELKSWLKANKLTKGDMCQAPFEILGWYNQLDSAATWELYKRCQECIEDYKDTWGKFYWDYHREDFMTLMMLQIEAYQEGLTLDLANLEQYSTLVDREMQEAKEAFLLDPRISSYIQEYEQAQRDLIYNKHNRLTATGAINKNWQKHESTKLEKMDACKFNIDSTDQIRWLITKVFDVKQSGKSAKIYERDNDGDK